RRGEWARGLPSGKLGARTPICPEPAVGAAGVSPSRLERVAFADRRGQPGASDKNDPRGIGAQAQGVAGLIVEIVVLQGDRIVVVDPDDHALAVITDLIVAQQLLEPIEIAAIMKIEDLGIEYQDVDIVDATMPEITDEVESDVCHAL